MSLVTSVCSYSDFYSNRIELDELSYFSSEATHVKSLIHCNLPGLEIEKIEKVHNNYINGMYQLKKAEYLSRYGSRVKEIELIHATSAYKVTEIFKENLNWRLVSRGKYGIGVSFSKNADYANFHCSRCNGDSRAFLICKVLVAEKQQGSQGMVIPAGDMDTTGNGEYVYVKYMDNEFVPVYVAYYKSPNRSESSFWNPYHFRRRRW